MDLGEFGDAKFRLLADMLPIVVIVLDPGGGLIYSNRHRLDYTALPGQEPQTEVGLTAFHSDDIGPVWASWQEALAAGVPLEPREVRYRRGSDGAYRWHRFSSVPQRDAEGRIEFWIVVGIDIHYEKEAEAAQAQLEAVNHLQRAILDGSNGAIMATTADDGVIQVFNTAAEALFGYSRQEAIGRRAIELLADEDDLAREAAQLSAELGRTVEPGRESMVGRARLAGTHRREWVYRHKNGDRLPGEISVSVLRDADGKVTGYLSFMNSLSEWKAVENALKESEERFRQSFEFSSIGMSFSGIDGRWLRVNRAVCEMLGYTEEELRRTTFLELTHPDDLPGNAAEARRLVAGEIPFMQLEKRYRHRQGHYLWARLTASVIYSATGQPLHYISQIENIDNWKRAEAALRESEEQLRTLVENAPEGIFVEVDQRLVYVNQPGVEMFGTASPDFLVGRSLAELCHADSRETIGQRFRLLTEEGLGLQPQLEKYLRFDGTVFEVEVVSVPFVFKGSKAALVFFRDISERRRLEEQLRQVQKMDAVGQLAGGVAHDFNNILAAMMLSLGILESEPGLDEGIRRGLKEVEGHAQRATNLIRQLLMFGRRSVMDVRTVSLNGVIENLLKMLQRLLGEQVRVGFGGGVNLPPIKADVGMLEQVLVNLSVNARDAMPRGGHLTIRTGAVEIGPEEAALHSGARTGSFVKLSVGDTGCGMDAATIRNIFDPFFTTKEVGKGTGLGLSTVDGIVNQHRGWIEVASEIDEGTVFTIFFPAEAGPESEPLPSRPGGQGDLVPKGAETILVVEDEALVRQGVVRILRMAGYRVVEAANGNEALSLWPRNREAIALLFTDMIMPESITGMELAMRLRQEKPELKVIVSSGYSMEMVSRGVPTDAGVVYLPKPYDMRMLGAMVRGCLDGVGKVP